MILSDTSILSAIDEGDIVIEPYDRSCLGTNSYDVHLSPFLACYVDEVIDASAGKNLVSLSVLTLHVHYHTAMRPSSHLTVGSAALLLLKKIFKFKINCCQPHRRIVHSCASP